MALFGFGSPKILTTALVEIALPHAVILKDEPEWDQILHENPITGKRLCVRNKYRWIFEVQIHLHEYAVPVTTFNKIYAALYDEVTLWRHDDGGPVVDSVGAVVKFWLSEITSFWLTNTNKEDAVILKFRSLGWVNLAATYSQPIVHRLRVGV
jgi:hypothetical protein